MLERKYLIMGMDAVISIHPETIRQNDVYDAVRKIHEVMEVEPTEESFLGAMDDAGAILERKGYEPNIHGNEYRRFRGCCHDVSVPTASGVHVKDIEEIGWRDGPDGIRLLYRVCKEDGVVIRQAFRGGWEIPIARKYVSTNMDDNIIIYIDMQNFLAQYRGRKPWENWRSDETDG